MKMKILNVEEVIPSVDSQDVALNSPIQIIFQTNPVRFLDTLDKILEIKCKTLFTVLHQFPAVDPNSDELCSGKTFFDPEKKILTFIPTHLLAPIWTYVVTLHFDKLGFTNSQKQEEETRKTYSWSFHTQQPLKPIRLQIKTSENFKRKLITINRNVKGLGYFSELKAKVASTLLIAPTRLGKILIHFNENIFHEIKCDRDIYLLKEMDCLIAELLPENEEQSSIYVHTELPRLSYEEYISQHWAPKWAGFYVVGPKITEQEELEIIQALFASEENQENL